MHFTIAWGRTWPRIAWRVAAFTIVSMHLPAFAAHPLATEDTGTQGAGKFELEVGAQRAREDASRATELGAQLSYGVSDALDLIVRPTLLDTRGEDDARLRGAGDATLGVKWRFAEAGPASLGTRVDVSVPTARRGLGAQGVGYRAALIATREGDAWSFHGNAGASHVSDGPDTRYAIAFASGAAVWAANDSLRFSFELTTSSPAERGSHGWPVAARVGAIARVTPSLSLDLGCETRISHFGPQSVVLAGATLHW